MPCACAMLPSVACHDLNNLSILSLKRHDFRKKKAVEHKICVLICCTNLSETFLILRRNERDMIKMSSRLHAEYALFSSVLN